MVRQLICLGHSRVGSGFATWDSVRAWLGAILFGGINAIQLRMQDAGTTILAAFLHMLPFIFTIVILFVDQSDRSHPSLSQWGVP